MKLVAYVRTSTANGANGDSPAAQREACEAWAAEQGHTIAEAFSDDGVSGRLGPEDRLGLAQALAFLEAGEAEGLIVHRLDRLARELHVQEAVLSRVWTTGGRVFEAVEGEVPRDDPNDPYRRFVRQVMGAAAELERGMVTARLQGGRRRKHAQGGYAGGPTVPIGKRVEGQGKAAKLVDDPDTRPVVERVITLRADGLTLREVAETLNAEGITGVRGGRWYPASVQRVLRREADRS